MGFHLPKDVPTALFEAGIPATAFAVEDIQKEYERIKSWVKCFGSELTKTGPITVAVLKILAVTSSISIRSNQFSLTQALDRLAIGELSDTE